jgi:hypothetical protein
MNANIESMISFITAQMDGEPVPAAGSAALKQVEDAIRELQKHQSGQELQLLALRTIGAVIDRVSSNISAEKTLRQFIQPGSRS